MNIGDLVIVKKPPFISGEEEGRMREGEHGIILDILESNFERSEELRWFCKLSAVGT